MRSIRQVPGNSLSYQRLALGHPARSQGGDLGVAAAARAFQNETPGDAVFACI